MIDRDELGAWLRLLQAPGVGRETARRLLAAFGTPHAVCAASTAALREFAGPAIAAALTAPSPTVDALVDRTVAWLAAPSIGARSVVTVGDALYPEALLESADPPLLLHAEGRIELLAAPSIAIVGSRKPTPQGEENARRFARELGGAGYVIVSGLALGIDAAAHEGALAAGAGTVAVVATGLDRVYPARHRALAHRIAESGLMLSEFPLGTPPLPAQFPVRNRIIAGLARGTLVVEAALRSGSLITARLASESGREVFAVPGSIHAPQARGCHALIKQGAKLVESIDDVLEDLPPWPGPARPGPAVPGDTAPSSASSLQPAATAPAEDDPVLEALGRDPLALDALAERTGWSAARLAVRLLELEFDGRLARLPGQRFQRLGD